MALEPSSVAKSPQEARPAAAAVAATGSRLFKRQQQPSSVTFQRHQFTCKQLKLAGAVKKPALQKPALQKQLSIASCSASQLQLQLNRPVTAALQQRQQQQQQQTPARGPEGSPQLRLLVQRKLLHLRQRQQLQRQYSTAGSDASSSECCGADSAELNAAATPAAQLCAALAAALKQQQRTQQQDDKQQDTPRSYQAAQVTSPLPAAPAAAALPQQQQQQQQLETLLQAQVTTSTASLSSLEADQANPAAAAAAPGASAGLPSSAAVVRALLSLAATHVSPALAQSLKQQLLVHVRTAAAAAAAAGQPFVVGQALQEVLPGLQVAVLKACTETQVRLLLTCM
jgi:hypothetical protein